MPEKALTVDELRDAIHRGEASDPLIFLESVMNGHDPRKLSAIYQLVSTINDLSEEGEIDPADWADVVKLVNLQYQYHSVSMSESTSAANTLAQYLHAKKKQVEMNTNPNGSNLDHDQLTEEEIDTFKQVWNDEF